MTAWPLEQLVFRISAKTLLQYCSGSPELAVGQGQWQGCWSAVILPFHPGTEVEKSMSQGTVGAGLCGLSELKHSFGLEII